MTVAERRFGGELVARTGKVTPFDDVGCLAIGALSASSGSIHSLWVTDFLEPDSVVAVERMVFLKTDSIHTPMSYGIVAVRPGPRADSLARALASRPWSWSQVEDWARQQETR